MGMRHPDEQVDADGFPVCTSPFRASDFMIAPAPRAAAAGAFIRTPPGQQIAVLTHVRAYADAAQEATGVTSWGTYIGHRPSPARATDAFVAKAQGDALCEWALRPENWRRFGLRYLMWWHRINYNDGRGWLWVEDRGSPTDNHMDHVHNAHEATAPEPPPDKEDDMAGWTDEEKAELISRLRSIDDNTNDIGARVFASLGAGDWESGADRLANAVRLIEELGREDGAGVDLDALADKVAERVGPQVAEAVAANLAERLQS